MQQLMIGVCARQNIKYLLNKYLIICEIKLSMGKPSHLNQLQVIN